MATLHFICGKAGAGKTTLARALGHELPAVVICEDEWLSQLSDPITSLDDYLKASRRLRNALTPHVVELRRLGNHVVLDLGFNNVTAEVNQYFTPPAPEEAFHVVTHA